VVPVTSCPCGHVFDEVPIAVDDAGAADPGSSEMLGPRPRSRSYIARHWRGELSLRRSYWLNGVVATIFLRMLVAIGVRALDQIDVNYTRVASLVVLWTLGVSLSTWQSVGIWRAANRSKARGWSIASKVCVCVWVVGAVAQYGFQRLPALWTAFAEARWLAENGSTTFRVLPGGSEMEVSGGIGPGFAEKLKKELEQRPAVRLLRVNLEAGGLTYEAVRARALIHSRGLTTEVTEVCRSACTVVFLGGSERLLRSGGLLGFHPSRVIGGGAPSRIRLASEMRYLADVGVKWDFAEQVAAVPLDSMWYPSIEQLTGAGVVTRVVFSAEDPPAGDSDPTPASAGTENEREQLPPKASAFLDLVRHAWTSLHIDARRPGVVVPSNLKSERQLVLQYGLDMRIPIPDLQVNDREVRATLSFSGHQEMTVIPWDAVYVVASDRERGVVYHEDVPPDVSLEQNRGEPTRR
jgi:hypothetical protein